jgi:carboxypeptidase family protein
MARGLMFRATALLSFLLAASGQHVPAAPSPATYRIAGIVVDSVTGQPLKGAEVNISPVANLDEQQVFLTSSGGRFLFADLPPGKYRLMASRRGYAPQALHQHEGFSTAIAVGPGLDSEHIRFPLAPSSVINGVVTDEWGDAVRDAKVLLFQQSMFDGSRTLRNISQTTTDDQGRYRFAHLLSAIYTVAVYARPWYAQSQVQVVNGDINVSENSVVGRAAETLTIDAPPPSSGADSLFDVVYPVTFFSNATSPTEATRFALAPGATETVDFQLRAVPSVHLRVRVPVQPPVTITTQQEDGQQTTNQEESSADVAQVDTFPDIALSIKIGEGFADQTEPTRTEIAPGILEFSGIPPGGVEVSLMTASVLSAKDGSVVSYGKTLAVSGDSEVDLSPQGDFANVSGVVLSPQFSSTPAAPAQAPPDQSSSGQASPDQAPENEPSNEMVTFRNLKTSETYHASISNRGKFSFASSTLPAGSYEVEFSGQSGLRVSSLEATGATVSGRTIEIPAGQPVNIAVHAAEANCSLSGFALKNGKPIAGAMVLLVPQDPGHDMSLYHRDQSDSDGSFTLSPLFPGRYILLAIENGWDLEWADPKVMLQYLPGGHPLELKPAASLSLNAKVQ